MSAICMRGEKENRISFIFRLFDEDGSGTIDRDEFAELVSGMMLTQSVGDEELKRTLQEEFDAADTDNSGELDEKEFIVAATAASGFHFERSLCLFGAERIRRQTVLGLLRLEQPAG